MNTVNKHYGKFLSQIYDRTLIYTPSEREEMYLQKHGFIFSSIRLNSLKLLGVTYPSGWQIKCRWPQNNQVASIIDGRGCERTVLAFSKWRNDHVTLPEFRIMPRFEIMGPVGFVNHETTRVFVQDNFYPVHHDKHIWLDRTVKLTLEEVAKGKYCDGSTSKKLFQEVLDEFKTKWPQYEDPEAYWGDDNH